MEEVEQVEAVVEPQQQQPNLTQEQLNRLIQDRMAKAADKARAEAETKHQAEMEQLRAQSGSMGGMQAQNPDDIARQVEQKIMDTMQQQQQQLEEEQRRQEVQGIAENYYSKVSKGAELFEDFDSVMADFDPSAFPEIVQLVAGMDNVPQVMYELSSNPQKLATISRLAERSSKMAQAQLNRLSQSIAKNEQAQASEGSVQPPLSHEKSSVRAGVDNGVNTVGDYKKMSFLKG